MTAWLIPANTPIYFGGEELTIEQIQQRINDLEGLVPSLQGNTHCARFELRQDEDTDRLYWWGAEDGWKDPTEIGENGVLTLDASAFAVGTVLTLIEPIKQNVKDA